MKCLRRLLILFCPFLLPAAAGAQIASLVRDLNTTGGLLARSGQPDSFVRFRDKALFRAVTFDAGAELWTTDGTPAGTELLADICPGLCAGNVTVLGPLGGALILASPEMAVGLWRSDATRAGTSRLTPPELTAGRSFAEDGKALFFTGCTPGFGCEPWVTDGTALGTRLVRDIVPGPGSSDPRDFARLSDAVYFFTGPELWRSDGTAGGTQRAAQLPGARARLLTAAGDRLFFFLNSSQDHEIWTSDGTAAGTASLARFPVRGSSFVPTSWLKAVGDRIFFLASDAHGSELWTSDGTGAGTRRVTDFAPELPFGSLHLDPDQLQVLGERLLFPAADSGGDRRSLWATSGNPASTRRLTDACLEGCGGSGGATNLVPFGGRVYFAASDGAHGRELWRTDGTAAGTVRVTDVCPGPCDGIVTSPYARSLEAELGRLLFLGRAAPRQQAEIWASDGTAAGTRQFTDVPAQVTISLDYTDLGAAGNNLLFAAGVGFDRELWASDDAPGRTRLLREIGRDAPHSTPSHFAPRGDRLFFRACDGLAHKIFQSAGTAATTLPLEPVSGLDDGCGSPLWPPELVVAGGLVFFWRSDDEGLPQVWRSDGTIAGTIQLTAIETSASPSAGYFLVALGDEVFFPVMLLEGHHDVREQVWRSDGTAQGTRFAFEPPGGRVPSRLTPAGGALYFAVSMNTSPQTTYEIWRSNGTTAGTERLLPQSMVLPSAGAQFTAAGGAVYFVVVGPAPPYTSELWRADAAGAIRVDTFGTAPVGLFELEGLLYFFLRGTSGWELWRSDGTTSGTVRVDTLPDPETRPLPPETAVVDGLLFLLPWERATGGLWVSDGAPGTLRRLADFATPLFAGTSLLAAAGGRLHFVGHDPAHGYELWVSDGTEAGTRLLHDLAPAPPRRTRSSSPPPAAASTSRPTTRYTGASSGCSTSVSPPASACRPRPRSVSAAASAPRRRGGCKGRAARDAPSRSLPTPAPSGSSGRRTSRQS